MFFGGWLYPDAPTVVVGTVEVTSNEKDALDCAAMVPHVAQTNSAPTKRKGKAFRTDISSLRRNLLAKTNRQDDARGFGNRSSDVIGLAKNLTWVKPASQ
jgi:hypothetical protein